VHSGKVKACRTALLVFISENPGALWCACRRALKRYGRAALVQARSELEEEGALVNRGSRNHQRWWLAKPRPSPRPKPRSARRPSCEPAPPRPVRTRRTPPVEPSPEPAAHTAAPGPIHVAVRGEVFLNKQPDGKRKEVVGFFVGATVPSGRRFRHRRWFTTREQSLDEADRTAEHLAAKINNALRKGVWRGPEANPNWVEIREGPSWRYSDAGVRVTDLQHGDLVRCRENYWNVGGGWWGISRGSVWRVWSVQCDSAILDTDGGDQAFRMDAPELENHFCLA